ncbi:MAG: VaFE repeat-containing surface-anchored protein [Lachnospiraceae bacterium]|nr:VaFE repeat-containing surface-anchored protein [Lachnospiraceae bacterium]
MKKFRKFIQRAMVVLVAAATVFQAVPVIAFAEEETAEAETTVGIVAEEAEEPVEPSGTESREGAIIMAVDAYLDGATEETAEETAGSQTEVSSQNEEKIEAAQATEGQPSDEAEPEGETSAEETVTEETEPLKEEAAPKLRAAAAAGNINVSSYAGYGDGDMLFYTNDFSSTYGSYWPAYCVDHGLWAPDGTDYYLSSTQNNALGYIMEHGYPNESIGLSWAEAQYLTQAAVYGVVSGHATMYEISAGMHSPAWIWAACFGGYYEEGSWSVNGNFAYAESLYQAAMAYATAADAQYALMYTPYDGNYQRMIVPVPVPKTENVTVKKTTSNAGCSAQLAGNHMYSQDFSGAQFTVTVGGTSWGTYTTGSDGTFTVTDVPIDSYVSVKETKAPAGYLLNSKEAGVTVTKGGNNTITVTDEPTFDSKRISVYKVAYINDQMTKVPVEGAVFRMEYFDNLDCSGTAVRTWYFATKTNGRFFYSADWLADGYQSDALYQTPGGDDDLPVGSFRITEVYSPKGYKLSDTVLKGTVAQPANGAQAMSNWVNATSGNIIVESDGSASFGNTPKYGSVTIEKFDADLKETNSGDTSFDGVEVQVINTSGASITLKDGLEISDGAVVATLVFQGGAHSVSTGEILPVGTYTIKESKTNKWYEMNTAWSEKATLSDDGADVLATVYASGKKQAELTEIPLRAKILLNKIDKETGKAEPQGEGSLENAEISIFNISENAVKVNGTVYGSYKGKSSEWIRENGLPCCKVYTDAEGITETPLLPGGTYLALETGASEGYLVNTEWAQVITIDGAVLRTGNVKCATPLEEQIIRGDLKAVKTEINGHKREGIPFAIDRIEKKEDGSWEIIETHIIVSDTDGIIDTSRKRSGNANALDRYELNGIFTDDSRLDPAVGVWFGEQGAVNDENGALICGTYRIRELQCKANRGEDLLLSDPIEVKTDAQTQEYDDILVDLSVEMTSILTEKESGTHSLPCKESVQIEDKITYTNLKKTMTYTMKAEIVLVDDPDTVLAIFSKDFRPSGTETGETVNSGEIILSGKIDTSGYEGKEIASRVTLIEHISGNSILISTHNQSLDDPDQSVYVVKISTTAKDMATGDNVGVKKQKDRIQDTVLCENLAPSTKYVLQATLVDKETGETIAAVDKVFTTMRSKEHYLPETEITMPEFVIDSSEYGERTLIVLESLYRCEGDNAGYTILDEDPLDVHDSLLDENQSIYYAGVKTEAFDALTGEHMGVASETVTVIDHVRCSNLIIGKEYTVKGELMYQEDFTDAGRRVHKKGSTTGITSEITFTAEAKNEVHDMTFVCDASKVEGAVIVVFENLYHNYAEIAGHADLEDETQTVWYPGIRTTATGTDGGKVIEISKTAVIKDTVEYSGLVPGLEYEIHASVYDKTAGKLLEGVEAERKFIPKSASGKIEVEIPVDTTAITGHHLVVFEKLFVVEADAKLVAEHEDANDTDQAVTVGSPPKEYPKTGDTSRYWIWLAVFGAAGAALIVLYLILVKKKKQNKEKAE